MNTNELPNPDYSRMCDRDLCVELTKYDAMMKGARRELIEIEAASSLAREKGEIFTRAGELGEMRIKFLHAVRQITRVREVQQKRAQSNHVHRAIKRGKAKR